MEGWNALWVDKVDEGVSNVASIFEVNRQVKEIIGTLMVLIDSQQKHVLVVFVGNVFDHQGGPCIESIQYLRDNNIKPKCGTHRFAGYDGRGSDGEGRSDEKGVLVISTIGGFQPVRIRR